MTKKQKLTPEWFAKHSLINEARQQLHYAIARSGTFDLDKTTAFFIVRREAWFEMMRDFEFIQVNNPTGRKSLLGLPVRISVEDEPDMPLIQLVMEPMARAVRK